MTDWTIYNSRTPWLWLTVEQMRVRPDGAYVRAADYDALLAEKEAAEARVKLLEDAGQAIVDRWDTPKWKAAAATADCINAMRAALAQKGE